MDLEAGMICYNILSRFFTLGGKPFFSEYGTTEKNLFLQHTKKINNFFLRFFFFQNIMVQLLAEHAPTTCPLINIENLLSGLDNQRRASVLPLADTVAQRRFWFAGHILHLPLHWPAKVAMTWFPNRGKHKDGRPKTTWRRTIIDDLEHAGVNWDEAKAIAADRQ